MTALITLCLLAVVALLYAAMLYLLGRASSEPRSDEVALRNVLASNAALGLLAAAVLVMGAYTLLRALTT